MKWAILQHTTTKRSRSLFSLILIIQSMIYYIILGYEKRKSVIKSGYSKSWKINVLLNVSYYLITIIHIIALAKENSNLVRTDSKSNKSHHYSWECSDNIVNYLLDLLSCIELYCEIHYSRSDNIYSLPYSERSLLARAMDRMSVTYQQDRKHFMILYLNSLQFCPNC